MGDVWPSMLFNLCVGLALAWWLLRRTRRFERFADGLLERMDRAHEENMRKYDTARDEIRASMRARVSKAITSSNAATRPQRAWLDEGGCTAHPLSFVKTTAFRGTHVPGQQEIRELPRWARVAFAARCVRRVLPLFEKSWVDAPSGHVFSVRRAVEIAEESGADGAAYEVANAYPAQKVVHDVVARDIHPSAASVALAAAEVQELVLSYVRVTPVTDLKVVAGAARTADLVGTAASGMAEHVRRDFAVVLGIALGSGWEDNTTISPSIFGPLWPDGEPEGWAKSEPPATEITLEVDVPDNFTTDQAVLYVKLLSEILCSLDLAGGGHGVAVRPPLEITAPILVPALA